jgi:hypothetical protein
MAIVIAFWVIFEIQNVWPFNNDRILLLRCLFAVPIGLSLVVFNFYNNRILVVMLSLISLILPTLFSKSVISVTYLIVSLILVSAIGGLSHLKKITSTNTLDKKLSR